MKKIIFILIFLLVLLGACQQPKENKVIFNLYDKPNSTYFLSIAEPLDGAYNNKSATFRQTITDSSNVEFIYKKKYPAVIGVEIDGRKFSVIMSPNTTVYVDIYPEILTNDWIAFRGDNASGHKLFNINLLKDFGMEIQNIFKENRKNYPVINEHIENYIEATLYPIDSLKNLKEISSPFAKEIKKNWMALLCSEVTMYYNYLYFAARGDSFTETDSIAIRSSQNKIFSSFSPLSSDILAYVFGWFYLSSYTDMAYHGIDSSNEKYIPEFNSYGKFGLLPDNLQKPMLGRCIELQYIFNINEYDKIKATAYFRKKYPDSDFLPVIDALAAKYMQSQANLSHEEAQFNTMSKETLTPNEKIKNKVLSFDDGIYIDTSAIATNIKTLKELHETYFKGEKIFIDLWATWCNPCIQEFAYKEQLDSLLKLHNITPVYLSLDNQMFKKKWEQFIYNNKLTGYHFLPSDTLINDIRRIANYSNPLSSMPIPHYIYMDKRGNIIEKNAPRPSKIKELADLFRKK